MSTEEKSVLNKICCIFEKYKCSFMKKSFKNTGLYRVLTGDTKTAQVSRSAVNIVFDRELSSQVYSKIDSSKEFTIQKGDKKYTVRQLQTL